MTSMRDESLAHYFAKLREFRKVENELSYQDSLAIMCLKIAVFLLEDKELGRAIAKELSLILDAKERRTTEEELFLVMQNIDHDLDENLRGFSGLMELILEDTRIRRDPHAVLSAVNDLEPHLLASFCRLTRALDALLELEEAFVADFSKAATVIFLLSLKDVMSNLFGHEQKNADLSIVLWLQGRIKNDALARLYEQATTHFCDFIAKVDRSIFTRDLVVVWLCLWSADQYVLNKEEATFIDQILCSMSMLGIKPLAQAGFLVLEEHVKVNEIVDVSPKIVLAT